MAKLTMAGNEGRWPEAGRPAVVGAGTDDSGAANVTERPFVVTVDAGVVVVAAVLGGTAKGAAGGTVLVTPGGVDEV
jgi:hypothetical protein